MAEITELERVRVAVAFALEAHDGQYYGDEPFAAHPLRVMARVSDRAKVVAVLHDVFEDTETGYPDWLLMHEYTALQLLTRRGGMTYREYIKRIDRAVGVAGEIAREVKIADLRDNIGHDPGESMLRRYAEALAVLAPASAQPETLDG